MSRIHRRDLLIGGTLTGLGVGCAADEVAAPPPPLDPANPDVGRALQGPPQALPPAADPVKDPEALPTRPFGKTGTMVTILGLGGMHNVAGDRELAVSLVERAYNKGIRFFDTAHVYAGSQWNIGEALEGKRANVFLQTKTFSRDRDGALRDLETSLKALRTSYLDSWLIHDIRVQRDIDEALAPNGVVEAALKAKEQGLIRNIGVSGHAAPDILKQMLEAHPFDCTLMAINAGEAFDKPFVPSVLPVAVKQNLGIVAMKTLAFGNLVGHLTMAEAIGWALSQPVSCAIVGANQLSDIDENTEVARAFRPFVQTELVAIELKVKPLGELCTFFRRGGWACAPAGQCE